MAEHPLFAPYLQEEGAVEGEAAINPLSEGLAQLKFDPDHSTPLGCKITPAAELWVQVHEQCLGVFSLTEQWHPSQGVHYCCKVSATVKTLLYD